MKLGEIIAVCFQKLVKHTNTVCRKNVELVNVSAHVRRVSTSFWESKKLMTACVKWMAQIMSTWPYKLLPDKLSVKPWPMSNLMHKILIYLYIIHLLKSCTCFEHYPVHLQEVYVVIVYVQPLVSSLSAGDCPVRRLRKKSSFLTGAQDSHLQTVTIPEAAYIELRRRPPEDEQGNARNMYRILINVLYVNK
jgi:hypothetical protein